MFADRAEIYVRSGKGGDGHISFRREKYVPNGGPDGGDGGNGGDVILIIDKGLNTLAPFRHNRKYLATSGEDGGKRNCKGKSGDSLYIKVPEGTIVKEATSGQIIIDMSGDTKEFLLLKGGRGGNGNQHYATSRMQAPKYAQPGEPYRELNLLLELKVIADVGLVGFPNVGKSTLLSMVSNARPEIANYHFTTLNPHLGVVDLPDSQGFIMADIPGIIEGASKGIGLGFDFLRHIERTRVLIHVVDGAGSEGRDPILDIKTINRELREYNLNLLSRPQIIAVNKLDLVDDKDFVIQKLKEAFKNESYEIMPICAATGMGIKELLYKVRNMLDSLPQKETVFESEYDLSLPADTTGAISVYYDEDEAEFVLEGPGIEKMLGYTNLDSEKGFLFFQRFLKERNILEELEALGVEDGDTVRMYGFKFDYIK